MAIAGGAVDEKGYGGGVGEVNGRGRKIGDGGFEGAPFVENEHFGIEADAGLTLFDGETWVVVEREGLTG